MQVVDIENERIQTKLVKQLLDTNEARHTKEASRALLIKMELVEPPWLVCSARARARAIARARETESEREKEREEKGEERSMAAWDLIGLTPVDIGTTSQARSAKNMRGLVRVELGLHRSAISGAQRAPPSAMPAPREHLGAASTLKPKPSTLILTARCWHGPSQTCLAH